MLCLPPPFLCLQTNPCVQCFTFANKQHLTFTWPRGQQHLKTSSPRHLNKQNHHITSQMADTTGEGGGGSGPAQESIDTPAAAAVAAAAADEGMEARIKRSDARAERSRKRGSLGVELVSDEAAR